MAKLTEAKKREIEKTSTEQEKVKAAAAVPSIQRRARRPDVGAVRANMVTGGQRPDQQAPIGFRQRPVSGLADQRVTKQTNITAGITHSLLLRS